MAKLPPLQWHVVGQTNIRLKLYFTIVISATVTVTPE